MSAHALSLNWRRRVSRLKVTIAPRTITTPTMMSRFMRPNIRSGSYDVAVDHDAPDLPGEAPAHAPDQHRRHEHQADGEAPPQPTRAGPGPEAERGAHRQTHEPEPQHVDHHRRAGV